MMTYVLSDIHGNLPRFESIMNQINLQSDDTLYILGDVVDRFHSGIKILRQIMQTKNIKMLLGNHEYMMLHAIGHCADAAEERENANLKQLHLWYRNGGEITHNHLKHIRKEQRAEVFDFLRTLPVNFDVVVGDKRYKLVHGSPSECYRGLYHYEYTDATEFAVWERWSMFDVVPDGYTLIFGHTPTCHFQSGRPWSIWHGDNCVGIDCGCGYHEGRLACLRLDDMKEFYSL